MSNKFFNRDDIKFQSIIERTNQFIISYKEIKTTNLPNELEEEAMEIILRTANDIIKAKEKGASRILTFGTHLVSNGLGPLLGEFIRRGWLTHLATTGTSIVNDFELASQGATNEDARANLPTGKLGMWQEPALYLNIAILLGAWQGLGLGESIGKMIADGGLEIPDGKALIKDIQHLDDFEKIASTTDLLEKIEKYKIPSGRMKIAFPYRQFSLQYAAWQARIPFTVHPMFGLDVFFMHPMNSFAAVGRTSETDFLYFVNSIDQMEDGIYISAGSSIASPMIYEKALSMSQNVRIPVGRRMQRHKILVVDLAESRWDWMLNGEPPESRPEYYLRYCKSFSRAKGETMCYISADTRDFFLHLYNALDKMDVE
jgi:hypothetical protein